jgi:uncharacterized membrane protein YozB (DUF420 family)
VIGHRAGAWATRFVLGLVRIWRGPGLADRMLAAHPFGTTGVALLLVLAHSQQRAALRDVALVLALLAVLAVLAFVARAIVATPMILMTAWRGLHRADTRHRAIARWTWPLWMYVSVSGVLVYLLLYHIYV